MMAAHHIQNQSGRNACSTSNHQFWPSAVVVNFSEGKLTKHALTELSMFGSAVAVDYSDFGIQITISQDLPQVLVINHHQAPSIKLSLEANVSVCVLHHFGLTAKPDAQTSSTININLDNSANLHYFLISSAGFSGNHALELNANLQSHSNLHFFDFSLHKGEIKSDYMINLDQHDAQLKYHAFSSLTKNAKCTSSFEVFHNDHSTASEQTFRGIYSNGSKGSFLGKVIIGKQAPKSSARQHYKSILLDQSAKAYVMPQLEVNNDDITASHGASIGELDSDSLFYLRTRGISAQEAKAMLFTSLASQITDAVDDEKIKCFINRHVDEAIKRSIGVDL